ncbi:MAG: SCO family protein [Acidobacteriota bacterium]|nr:SCO family protein [Acidobacteriota bacterium]
MSSIDRRRWLALSGSALVGTGLATQTPGQQLVKTGKRIVSPRERVRERYLPNFTLTTHEGKQVKFYDDLVKDKIVVINMMYAQCQGVCTPITANLVKVHKLLGPRVGKDIFMYSITIQPEKDSPKALKHYADMHKIKPGSGWLFLTGKPDEIETLRRKLGFVDPDPVVDRDKSNHIGNVRFGSEPRMLWAACPGLARASAIANAIAGLSDDREEPPDTGEKGGR